MTVAEIQLEPGRTNRVAMHDTGLAVAQLSIQATALGLAVHQMGGFSQERARSTYGIPKAMEPIAVLVIGYPAEASTLDPNLQERENAPRVRKEQDELVFAGYWGAAAPLVSQG